MTNTHIPHRLLSLLLLGGLLAQPLAAEAADPTTFVFASHCKDVQGTPSDGGFAGPLPDVDPLIKLREEDGTVCSDFTVLNPGTLQTPVLKAGDKLTVIVKIANPTKAPVIRARAWLIYDPAVLEGAVVGINSAFSIVTPGEESFYPAEGYVKIGASAEKGITKEEIILARVVFTVKPGQASSTVLSYYDHGATPDSRTSIVKTANGVEEPILNGTPGSLMVRLTPETPMQTVTTQTASAPSSQPAVPSAPGSASSSGKAKQELKPAAAQTTTANGSAIFPEYRVENLRVTTQGTAAYLGWDILPSAELAGYNVYYGATSGQYLQRKTIDKSETTLAIRGLPEGSTYYFAVRGVNAAGVETEFSDEVSVVIGRAETSTSPLSASMIPVVGGKRPEVKTDGTVKGDTGAATTVAVVLAACALAGTLAAARKQYAFSTPHDR